MNRSQDLGRFTLLSTKGKKKFPNEGVLGPEISRKWDVSTKQKNWPNGTSWAKMARKVPGAGCPLTHWTYFFPLFSEWFFSQVNLLTRRLGAQKSTSPCSSDKPIHLGSLTETILYLVITQNSPLICICLNLFFFQIYYTDLARLLSSFKFPPHFQIMKMTFLIVCSR